MSKRKRVTKRAVVQSAVKKYPSPENMLQIKLPTEAVQLVQPGDQMVVSFEQEGAMVKVLRGGVQVWPVIEPEVIQDSGPDIPQEELDAAKARLEELECLTPFCAWDKFDFQLTVEEALYREKWHRVMDEQTIYENKYC